MPLLFILLDRSQLILAASPAQQIDDLVLFPVLFVVVFPPRLSRSILLFVLVRADAKISNDARRFDLIAARRLLLCSMLGAAVLWVDEGRGGEEDLLALFCSSFFKAIIFAAESSRLRRLAMAAETRLEVLPGGG